MITFSCRRCTTRFTVPDEIAGKKARCKKCGQHLQVPQAPVAVASGAATGLFRMGTVQADQAAAQRTPIAESKVTARAAAPSSIRLAPISLDDLKAVAERERLWDEEDKVEYELERPVVERAEVPVFAVPKQRRRLFWGRGGIAEVLLITLRKLSDYAYLISLPFLLLLLLAIILKQRELAITAAVVIILLNIVRFGIDGFVLVALAFKTGPVDGVLFFIPPFTFHYLNKRGKIMKEALNRFLGPAVPIIGVLLLFIFVPWLRGGEANKEATIHERLRSSLSTVKERVETKTQPAQDSQN